MAFYRDKKGNRHELDDVGLDKAVEYKLELQKDTGKANWTHLCRLMREDGYDDVYPSEGLRTLVKYHQAQKDMLPHAETSDDKITALHKEIGELSIAKRELQNINREHGKLKRELADGIIYHDEVVKALKENPIVVNQFFPSEPTSSDSNDVMVVVLSDEHFGALVELSDNTYNAEIAKELMHEYLGKVLANVKLHHPKKIYVVNLGDEIEGAYMRNNQSYTIEMGMGEQVVLAIKLISEFMVNLVENTSAEVVYTGIAGNHSRMNGNKRDNLPQDNVTTIVNSAIMSLSERTQRLSTVLPDTIYRTHLEINGKQLSFVHGDLDNIAKKSALAEQSQYDGRVYDVLVGGHLHSTMITENNGYVIQSGSLIGKTDYNDTFKGSASRSQIILNIDGNGEIVPSVVKLG